MARPRGEKQLSEALGWAGWAEQAALSSLRHSLQSARDRREVSLTNQLERQDTMWHCPLDVIMLCGCEVISSHKVCLKEIIVWVIQTNSSSWF